MSNNADLPAIFLGIKPYIAGHIAVLELRHLKQPSHACRQGSSSRVRGMSCLRSYFVLYSVTTFIYSQIMLLTDRKKKAACLLRVFAKGWRNNGNGS
mgnify:CR=1 FL=1